MSQSDITLFHSLKSVGAIEPIRQSDFPKGGYVKIACPDGDTTPELVSHLHYEVCPAANGGPVCTHLITIGGGPGAIPGHSPLNTITYRGVPACTADAIAFAQIELALKAKGERVRNLALCPHCTCAAATMHGLSLLENLRLTFIAKDMIRREFPKAFESIKVMPHLCFHSGGAGEEGASRAFKTYIVRRDPFLRYYEQQRSGATKIAA